MSSSLYTAGSAERQKLKVCAVLALSATSCHLKHHIVYLLTADKSLNLRLNCLCRDFFPYCSLNPTLASVNTLKSHF